MGESRGRAIQNLSLEIEKYPRDLLRRFTSSTTQQSEYLTLNEDSEEIELNLGLSMGGRFGVDKNASKLIRSSSIAGPIPLTRDESTTPPRVSSPILIRTSSLPTETEEEWRKRKELQTLRRMEAKRRRSEKQRTWNANLKVDRDGGGSGGCSSLEEQQFAAVNRFSLAAAPPSGMGSWAAAAGQMNSQGSVELQGGSSSGMSELESKAAQGSGSCGEERSPASNQSLQERRNQEAARSSGTKTDENACRTSREEVENPLRKLDSATNKGKEIGMKPLKDMPCVFTKGDGPNGRRIEGILYKYGKGQEVRIMCVCHGSFLSPAEFVKHAGGGDVAHPLKHIVVNPSASVL